MDGISVGVVDEIDRPGVLCSVYATPSQNSGGNVFNRSPFGNGDRTLRVSIVGGYGGRVAQGQFFCVYIEPRVPVVISVKATSHSPSLRRNSSVQRIWKLLLVLEGNLL